MRMMTFAKRCSKEILRDPINLGFGLGFPLVLLVLLSAMQANIPVSLFEIDTLTPGITVFGLSFMTLFSATLIAKDRESALLQRLYTTPLTGFDFIMGYMLPLLPIAIGQVLICYLFAIPLGLTVSANIVYAVIGIIPMAVFNISLGLLCGSVFGVKQVGGINSSVHVASSPVPEINATTALTPPAIRAQIPAVRYRSSSDASFSNIAPYVSEQTALRIWPGKYSPGAHSTMVSLVIMLATVLGMMSQKMIQSHFPRIGARFAMAAFLISSCSIFRMR